MTLRLLAASFAALSLALGTLGCSDKDDASPTNTPPAAGRGRYTVNDRVADCAAGVATYSDGTTDYLFVELGTEPAPAAGYESLRITYTKTPAQTAGSFRASTIQYELAGQSPVNFTASPTTLELTSSGGFSGTFRPTSSSGTYRIANGAFTDVRP
jgi:hypothetical protein